MAYIENFYLTLKHAIEEAGVHVSLFLPFLTKEDLTFKTGFLWKKSSLLSALISFSKKKYTHLELLCNDASLTPFFKNFNPQKTLIKQNIDVDFITPLISFAESFAIIDGKGIYVKPMAHLYHSGAVGEEENDKRALFFQRLFTQILQHEQKLDSFLPDKTVVNLVSVEEDKEELFNFVHEINSLNIVDFQNLNPFVNRFYQQQNIQE